MGYIEIWEGDDKKFDSDDVIPEQLDPERDHITAHRGPDGRGWSISTPEQVERQVNLTRPASKDCPTCEGNLVIPITSGRNSKMIDCPTCTSYLDRGVSDIFFEED